jgi:sec-independent protein translocase protein TatA
MFAETALLGFIQNLGPVEIMIIVGFGIILFGRRLPEVGRSLGKSIVEFKKGLRGIEEEVDQASTRPDPRTDDRAPSGDAPKFDIPRA